MPTVDQLQEQHDEIVDALYRHRSRLLRDGIDRAKVQAWLDVQEELEAVTYDIHRMEKEATFCRDDGRGERTKAHYRSEVDRLRARQSELALILRGPSGHPDRA